MIVRQLDRKEKRNVETCYVRPAWQVFLETQKVLEPPYAVILQPDHSALAGRLAANLRPSVFGELVPEVTEAIGEHDRGWQASDESQLNGVGADSPRPFPLVSPQEAVPCWRESIRRAERISSLRGVITSRHFCALAPDDSAHHAFIEDETRRREQVERTLGIPAADLDRWTDVIGFCDLVSLYLCSGTTEPVELPLAHPALPKSREAPKVSLEWTNGHPRFSSPLVNSGADFSIVARKRLSPNSLLEPHTLAWTFVA